MQFVRVGGSSGSVCQCALAYAQTQGRRLNTRSGGGSGGGSRVPSGIEAVQRRSTALSRAPLQSTHLGTGPPNRVGRGKGFEVKAYQSQGSKKGGYRGRGRRGRGPPKPRGPPKNEDIRAKEVRVIGSKKENLGIMKTSEALSIASEEGLDLLEITPGANPPVCRIVDFGKYMYEQEKKKKEAKKGQSKAKSAVKELKLRPNTDVHDYNVRLKRCLQFLAKGNKVKITVVFSGRDMVYKDKGRELLKRFENDVADEGHVDGRPNMQGRQMMMFINPGPKKDK